MINFTKPDKLNGEQLVKELQNAGITVKGNPRLEGELFFIDIEPTDEVKASKVVGSHIGIDIDYASIKASALAKLAALGLTEDEVKSIVG